MNIIGGARTDYSNLSDAVKKHTSNDLRYEKIAIHKGSTEIINVDDVQRERTKQITINNPNTYIGNLSKEEYNEYVNGVKDYYDNEIKYIEEEKKYYEDLNKTLSLFKDDKNLEYVINTYDNAISEKENERMKYYLEYGETNNLFKNLGITSEQYQNMSVEKRIEYLRAYDSELIDVINGYNDYIEKYDKQVEKEFSYLGIKTCKELKQTILELNNYINNFNEALMLYKNTKDSSEYDYLYFLSDFKNFKENDLSKYVDAVRESITTDLMSNKVYSYTAFHQNNPNISELEYMKIVQSIDQDGIYVYEGISNSEDLKTILEVEDKLPEFAKTYNYLYSEDPSKAQEYLETCKYEINNIKGQLLAEEFVNSLNKLDGNNDTIMEAVANEFGVSVEGLKDGLSTFGMGIVYVGEAVLSGAQELGSNLGIYDGEIYENRTMTADEYKKMYILQALLSTEEKEELGLITKDNNGNYINTNKNSLIDFTKSYTGALLSENYEISQGIGNMLPSILLSTVCPMAGSVSMGLSAGGNAYHGAMVEGQSINSAIFYGMFTGFSEAISERMLGGIPGLSATKITSLKTYLQSMLKEGTQEMVQGLMDETYKAAFMGKELPSTVEGWKEFAENIGKQGVYGAVTAGILNVSSVATYTISSTNNSNQKILEFSMNRREAMEQIANYFGEDKFGYLITLSNGGTIADVESRLSSSEIKEFRKFLNSPSGKYISSLTTDEIDAIVTYSNAYHMEINEALRTNDLSKTITDFAGETTNVNDLVNDLDSAIKKYGGLQQDTKLWRGANLDIFKNTPYENLFNGIDANNMEEVYKVISTLVGKEITDLGYMSTSLSYDGSNVPLSSVALEIIAPKGTEGAYINDMSNSKDEYEFLLQRGTNLKITSVDMNGVNELGQKQIHIVCEVTDNTVQNTVDILDIEPPNINKLQEDIVTPETKVNEESSIPLDLQFFSDNSSESFNNLVNFFKTDGMIKREMINLAPPANLDYADIPSITKYSDNLEDTLKFVFNELKKSATKFDNTGMLNNMIDNLKAKIFEKLANAGLDLDRLKIFYRNYISNMNNYFIDSVKAELSGYYNSMPNNSLSMVSSLNEALHLLHQFILNDEHNYQSLEVVDSKKLSDYDDITLYGVNNNVALSIYENFTDDLGAGQTDIVGVDDNHTIIMIRDKGHALSIELTTVGDKVEVNYFIPKICDPVKVNALPGINKVSLDTEVKAGATGMFDTTVQNVSKDINELIKNVPDDGDLFNYYFNNQGNSGVTQIPLPTSNVSNNSQTYTSEVSEAKKIAHSLDTPYIEDEEDVHNYFENWSKKVIDNLTPLMRMSINDYSYQGNELINNNLRIKKDYECITYDYTGNKYSEVEQIDKAIDSSPLERDIIAYRSLDLPHLLNDLGVDSIDNVANLIGLHYKDNAYTSATVLDFNLNPSDAVKEAFLSKDVYMILHIKEGTKALYMESLSHFPDEYELLIHRGIDATIFDAYEENGKIYLECLVGDDNNE